MMGHKHIGVNVERLWSRFSVLVTFLLLAFSPVVCPDSVNDVTYVRDGGLIRSRLNLFGKKYLKLENQTWILQAEAGHWALVFHTMDIETSDKCDYDYLQVKENDPAMPVVRYCGDTVPLPYISDTFRLELKFITDSIWEHTGFSLTAYHGPSKEALKARISGDVPEDKVTLDHNPTVASTKQTTTARKVMTSSGPDSDTAATQRDGEGTDDVTEGYGENYGPQAVKGQEKSSEETMFFILLGSAAAALVLFGILLIYFLTLARKPPRSESLEPEIYFSSSVSTTSGSSTGNETGSFVRLISDKKRHPTIEDMCKSGKRYCKDKNSIPALRVALSNDGQTVTAVQKGHVVPADSQHNTTYY